MESRIKLHTPGPWKQDESFSTFLSICDSGCAEVCDVDCHNNYEGNIDPSETEQANAHLIAAAPELLQAAEIGLAVMRAISQRELTDMVGDKVMVGDACMTVSSAIAKAYGDTP